MKQPYSNLQDIQSVTIQTLTGNERTNINTCVLQMFEEWKNINS